MIRQLRSALARAIAPKPIAKRTAFAGADFSRLNDWVFSATRSIDAELKGDLRSLRNRARTLVRNSPMGFRYQQLVAENVIGPYGIRLKPTNVVKRSGDQHTNANDAIKAAWLAWSKPGMCEVTRKLSLTELLALETASWSSDGEILMRLWKGPQFGPHGFMVQALDPDLLDDQLNQERMGSLPLIRQGVEFDEFGAPVNYYLWSGHPTDPGNRTHSKVPADQIIHAFLPLRPGQSRGIPHAAAIMGTLNMLDGYTEAELVAARWGAATMGAVEDIPGTDGPAVNPNAARDDATGGRDIPLEAEPGAIMDLRGMQAKVSLWDPQHPTSAFPSFTTKMQQLIAVGLGISYGTLTGDLSQSNYGSLRIGMLDERDHWKRFQSFVIDHVLDRIYDAWLPMALLNGQVQGVREYDATRWNRRKWYPRGFDWIDPLKDAQGELIEVAAGVNTLTRMAAKRGDDLEEIVAERAEELKMLAKYGVTSTLATTIPDSSGAAPSSDATDTPDASTPTDDARGFSRSLPVIPFRAANGARS